MATSLSDLIKQHGAVKPVLPPEIQKSADAIRSSIQSTTQTPAKPDLGQQIADTYLSAGSNITDSINKSAKDLNSESTPGKIDSFDSVVGKTNSLLSTAAHTVGDVAGAAFAPLMEGASAAIPQPVKDVASKAAQISGDLVNKIPGATHVLNYMNENWDALSPDAKQTISRDLPNILAVLGGSKADVANPEIPNAKTVVSNVAKDVSNAKTAITDTVTGKTAPSAASYIDASGKKVYTKLTPDELSIIRDEINKIPMQPSAEVSQLHLDPLNDQLKHGGTEIGRDEFIKGHPQAEEMFSNTTKKQPVILDEKSVLDKYNKAIKPSVSGKANAGQIETANTKVVSGLKTIADNKPNLEFTNSDGDVVKGEAPKTVDQLSQAIDQTKKTIFEKYDTLAKQAGEKGVTVDTKAIADELNPVIESKSLKLVNPKVIDYVKSLQSRLIEAGGLDAETAQDVIKHYNDSLKAYYRNPSYETASQASVDALIANKLRVALDEGITGATGEQYQTLKDQYGALSSMEKDVARRNVVWGRQNQVGLASSLSNVASGAELVRGLLTMNPADIAVSGAIKGVQKYIQYLNNPDVGVSKIFSEIEKSNPSSIGSMSGSKE